MIVHLCRVESCCVELLAQMVLYLALALDTLLVAERVHLMHEDLKDNIRVDLVGADDRRLQPRERLRLVVLSVDDPDESTAVGEGDLGPNRRGGRVHVPREVPHLKLNERRVGDVIHHQLVGALEEEGLVWGHLVEDHFLNRALPSAPQPHQEHTRLGQASIHRGGGLVHQTQPTISSWVKPADFSIFRTFFFSNRALLLRTALA